MRTPVKEYLEPDGNWIHQRYKNGTSISQLARDYGCSRWAISELLKRHMKRPRNVWSKHATRVSDKA